MLWFVCPTFKQNSRVPIDGETIFECDVIEIYAKGIIIIIISMGQILLSYILNTSHTPYRYEQFDIYHETIEQ